MTEPQKTSPQKQPLERKTRPLRKDTVDTNGMLSLVTMLVSLAAISIALGGGVKLILDVFEDGLINAMGGIPVKVGVLGFTFFFGWVIGLVSIRGFGNRIYPVFIKIYTWGCLVAVGILYIKVIQKLYMQEYDTTHFGAYLIILIGALFVLFLLHLLVEGHDLRPFAIPLLIISVLHLFVIVYHYIFEGNIEGRFAMGDFTVFLLMITISGLMLLHIGIVSPMREQISGWFSTRESENNGDGGT
jgi:hypothetical protein